MRQLFCRKIRTKGPLYCERHKHTYIHIQNNIQQMLMAPMRNPIANTHYTQTKRVDHDIEKFNTSLNKFGSQFGSHKTDTWEIKQSIISSLFLPATPNSNRLLCFLFEYNILFKIISKTMPIKITIKMVSFYTRTPNVSLASERKKSTHIEYFFNKLILQFEL